MQPRLRRSTGADQGDCNDASIEYTTDSQSNNSTHSPVSVISTAHAKTEKSMKPFLVPSRSIATFLYKSRDATAKKKQEDCLIIRLCLIFCVPILVTGTVLSSLWRPQVDPVPLDNFTPNVSNFTRFTTNAPQCEELSVDNLSFTLVTQLSEDRLWMMEHHCQRWGLDHPMSIAVMTSQSEDQIAALLTDVGCSVDSISIHVYQSNDITDYPVNKLRNLALSSVQTTHVVYLDSDFWPSPGLWEMLYDDYVREKLAESHKHAIVLPAFQLQRQCREESDECRESNVAKMPRTQSELYQLLAHRQATQFDPTNPRGHGSTRYRDWFGQWRKQLLPISCVTSNRYEPYLVFRYCHDLPPFQELFSGYGKNKMTWVMQLLRSGWKLWQIPQAFITHYPHLDSPSRMVWNGGEGGETIHRPSHKSFDQFKRGLNDQLFVSFRQWLAEEVPDETVLERCENAVDDDAKLWIDREE